MISLLYGMPEIRSASFRENDLSPGPKGCRRLRFVPSGREWSVCRFPQGCRHTFDLPGLAAHSRSQAIVNSVRLLSPGHVEEAIDHVHGKIPSKDMKPSIQMYMVSIIIFQWFNPMRFPYLSSSAYLKLRTGPAAYDWPHHLVRQAADTTLFHFDFNGSLFRLISFRNLKIQHTVFKISFDVVFIDVVR